MKIKNNILIEVEDSDIVNGTFNIPEEVETIGYCAFCNCEPLEKIIIPNNVRNIERYAFINCNNLVTVVLSDNISILKKGVFKNCKNLINIKFSPIIEEIRFKAFFDTKLISIKNNYKAFKINDEQKLQCLDEIFFEDEWSKNIEDIQLQDRGYHYCTNLFEIFNYYSGRLNEDIIIYECEVGDKIITSNSSLCVTNKIKPKRRLCNEEIIMLLNN